MMKTLTRLLPILALLSLAACGFHPRGEIPQISSLPGPVYIAGIGPYSPLHRALSTQLRSAGVQLTADPGNAGSQLSISDYRTDQRLFGVDSLNRATEYELTQSLSFALRDANGKQLVEPQSVSTVRNLYRPVNQVLASDDEAHQLRQEMTQEMASKIIRRLAAQH